MKFIAAPIRAFALAGASLLAACGGGTPETEAPQALAPQDAAMSAGTTTMTPGSVPSAPGASQIVFSGHTFQVRSGAGGPGPNTWSAQNVWVDSNGYLHLKISQQSGQWSTAEIWSNESFGFGTYQFKVIGHPESLDKNVVLGLFNYPTPAIGGDGTNEIDIEFATWGGAQSLHGNWTVWPAASGRSNTTHAYNVPDTNGQSTHRFNWTSRQVAFDSSAGLSATTRSMYAHWTFAPLDYLHLIPQHAEPLHMNFWLFQGLAPSDGQEAEIVISEFDFTPAKTR